jgi:aminoglycoside phosphotransferase (APT) family kinase protein
MKEDMLRKIEQLQSDKESFLLREVEQLKELLESSREERECELMQEAADLRAMVFKLEAELNKASIRFSLMERKKDQAVKEAVDKKDQEVKVQKSLTKSLA